MNIAFFVYNHTESSIALAKNLSKNNCIDYYYITSRGNRYISSLGFGIDKTKKLGFQKLDDNELIFKYIDSRKINFYLIVIPFWHKQLEHINRIYLQWLLKKKHYDAINVVGQDKLLLQIHKIFKSSLRLHTLHEVNDHSRTKPSPIPILKHLVKLNVPLVFHSNISQNRFLAYYKTYKLTYVIPMGPFDSFSIFNTEELSTSKPTKNNFLFYGYIHPYKGLKYFIEAIKIASVKIPDIEGTIAGMGNDPVLKEIENDKRFIIINKFIDDQYLVELILKTKAVVCPYTSASQSGIPLTAYVFNKPVIATDLPGFNEIVVDNKLGYIVPVANSGRIADKFFHICNNKEAIDQLTANIEKAKSELTNLNWDAITDMATNLIENLKSTIMTNIVVVGDDFAKGMAESQLIRNMFAPLQKDHALSIHNLRNKRIEPLNLGSSSDYKFDGILAFLFNRRLIQNKVLYVYGYPSLKNIFFILLFSLFNYKTIFHITEDLRYQSKTYTFKGKVNIKSSLLLVRNISYLSKGCIVISKRLEDRIRSVANPNYPILNLPISIDIDKIQLQKPKTQNKDHTIHTFFYGGSFAPKDGMEIIIKAFEKITKKNENVQLVITGKGVEDDERIVKEIIENSDAIKNIHFKGYLSYNDYLKELWCSDVLIMNRIDNEYAVSGFPFKLGEYLATGKVVVASAISSVREFLQDHENALLFKPESAGSLSEAFQYSIDNKGQLSHLGEEGKKTAFEYFDNKKHAKLLNEFIEKIVPTKV